MYKRQFVHGHTFVATGGVTTWIPPGVHFPGPDEIALALGLLEQQIGDRAGEALSVIGGAGASFPDRPRFHCVYVGVRRDAHGRGTGSTLMRRELDVCDRDVVPVSLVSTNDANLPWYRSLGFVEIGEVPIPGAGCSLRPMWREPAS